MFRHQRSVQLGDTDSYGILFFANQLRFCHDAFQAWLESIGRPIAPQRAQAEFVAVMVHVESDYLAPIQLGDRLDVSCRCAALGTTSFTNAFTFTNQTGVAVGTARTVQVTVDPATAAKMALPSWLRAALEANR